MAQQYDFIAIGDITVDAFIELSKEDARVTKDEKTGRKKLEMDFGGKLPYEDVTIVNAVGNSAERCCFSTSPRSSFCARRKPRTR